MIIWAGEDFIVDANLGLVNEVMFFSFFAKTNQLEQINF